MPTVKLAILNMIKTRFAPSPTGYLHIGGLRTALYAYLFAKKMKGQFILRIEDTDRKREVEGAADKLMEILRYFDLNWDEGPFFQSERTELYKKHVEGLLESGKAYRCFCTPERLQEMREAQQKRKQAPKYDRHCLKLAESTIEEKLKEGTPFVIRQLIPEEEVCFVDQVRGRVCFHGRDVDDQVLMKSDGYPTYHLANVVDDHDMGITHVIRGEEWLPSTPKHIWLYHAFGWDAPEFAHLPLLLNADKTKLSKRQGDVAAEDYIQKGYLKEAIINFIAFLGWNPGTEEEHFSLAELIDRFSLDRVQKAGAVFNVEKLDWLNAHYLRAMSDQDLAKAVLPYLQKETWFKESTYKKLTDAELEDGTSEVANDFLKYVDCIQSRLKTFKEAPEHLKLFLLDEFDYDRKLFMHEKMKIDAGIVVMALEASIEVIGALKGDEDEATIKAAFVDKISELGVKNGHLLWPLRVALSNEAQSPGGFEIIHILGKEKSLKRIQSALTFIGA